METQLALLTHHQPDGWSPALEKGGYTLGLTPIAFSVQGHNPEYSLSALYKGGGPLRLRNGGGLAAGGGVSIHRNLQRQVPPIGH